MGTSERLLTAEAYLRAAVDDPSELWDGAVVLREPSGGWHGIVEARIARSLRTETSAGWVFGSSTGYVVARDPDRVLAPDLSFLSRARLPIPPRAGFIEGAPQFAVEIRSPHDSWISVIEKGGIWIAHGVQVVWCIDTDPVRVAVLRPGAAPALHGLGDRIDVSPVLDFGLTVDDLFEGLL